MTNETDQILGLSNNKLMTRRETVKAITDMLLRTCRGSMNFRLYYSVLALLNEYERGILDMNSELNPNDAAISHDPCSKVNG